MLKALNIKTALLLIWNIYFIWNVKITENSSLKTNPIINEDFLNKILYDPSIGKESLTAIDVLGVLVGHCLFGVAATLLIDWSWIPLSPNQKNSGKSLKDIKESWGWDEETDLQEECISAENKKS